MIVDDLVQGPVGWNLSIVGCPDMLDVNFFGGLVGHRFSRCRVLSPLRHRLFTRGGALSPVWALPLPSRGPDSRWSKKIRSNWWGLYARLHFRKASSARYRMKESVCSNRCCASP